MDLSVVKVASVDVGLDIELLQCRLLAGGSSCLEDFTVRSMYAG
jgi:hypothetical protein